MKSLCLALFWFPAEPGSDLLLTRSDTVRRVSLWTSLFQTLNDFLVCLVGRTDGGGVNFIFICYNSILDMMHYCDVSLILFPCIHGTSKRGFFSVMVVLNSTVWTYRFNSFLYKKITLYIGSMNMVRMVDLLPSLWDQSLIFSQIICLLKLVSKCQTLKWEVHLFSKLHYSYLYSFILCSNKALYAS